MADFSLALNEDQIQLKKWVHGFAEEVMRPAGAEWDEREETPWPIVQEAAKIGLYGWEIMAEVMMNDPTGISPMVLLEELFWGDAGIAHVAHGFRSGCGRDRSRRIARAGHGVGSPVLLDPPMTSSSGHFVRPSPMQVRTSRRSGRTPSTTKPTTSGRSTGPRPGSPTAVSPIFTSLSP